MIASPGNKVIYGEYRMKSLPSASMEPHSGRGGCTPIPIKLIPAAVSIIVIDQDYIESAIASGAREATMAMADSM